MHLRHPQQMVKDPEPSVVQNLIYDIRGEKVMLDYDLARLYQVETRVLNQAVKRSLKRFPPDFMFQLTPEEVQNMPSQIVIASKRNTNHVQDPESDTSNNPFVLF